MSCLILHGRRLLHLQKCRLHFSVPLHNAFSSSSAADLSVEDNKKGKTFTVSYLVDSLGLSTKLAESISKRISFQDKGNPDSVLSLLTRYGFTASQISTIVTTYPQLLVQDSEKSLAPKLQFLHSTKGAEFTDIISKIPKLLGLKYEKATSTYYDFIKETLEADNNSSKLPPSSSHGSQHENIIRNVSVLRELGVPQRFLFPLLISNRNVCFGKERFGESLNKVIDLGFDPSTSKFISALQIVYRRTDKTLEDKVQVYQRLGFAVDDVWALFKKFPYVLQISEKNILNSFEAFLGLGFTRDEFVMMVKCFPSCIAYSVELVKKKTEFLVKQMDWCLKDVAMAPQVLGLSLEKRIGPRCEIVEALLSKGQLGSELPPMSILKSTDEEFLKRYVRKHDDEQLVLELMAMFTKDRVS